MKVLIIEDEQLAAERLRELILKYDRKIEIAGIIESVKTTVQWIEKNGVPDLVFMDIQLADGLSFGIFEKVKLECPVIFTTAYQEYAVRAFKVNSIDYLLKPIDFGDLKKSMIKYHDLYRTRPGAGAIDLKILESVRAMITQKYRSRFSIKIGEHIRAVNIENILYFFSYEKGTFIQAEDSRRYLVDDTLDQLEASVDPQKFFRLNRKYLVSYRSIADIIAYSNSRLKINLKNSDDNNILISREKVPEFRAWLDS